jgi:hypothetical protein
MPISWNEIRDRSLTFSREWADESSEDAEAKSFWDGFFNVFGISEREDSNDSDWVITLKVQEVSKDKFVEVIGPVVKDILDVREA